MRNNGRAPRVLAASLFFGDVYLTVGFDASRVVAILVDPIHYLTAGQSVSVVQNLGPIAWCTSLVGAVCWHAAAAPGE